MRRNDPKLDQAQDLMWTAFDTASRSKRIELARKALELSQDCADAYVVLADDLPSKSLKEKIDLLEQGVKAGLRAIGTNTIKESDGWLWGTLEARPYLRARFSLALALHDDGQIEQAIAHYNEILKLNSHDNQGVRYVLIPLLVSLKRLKEATQILKKYSEDTGVWVCWSRTLLHLKQRRDSKVARKALVEAISQNHHVLTYLFDPSFDANLPSPEYYSPGTESEAYLYCKDWRFDWLQTEGAMPWILERLVEGYMNFEAPEVVAERRRIAKIRMEAEYKRIQDLLAKRQD